jgi:hypothetical protein
MKNFDPTKWTLFVLACTVPISLSLILVLAAIKDRVLDQVVSGGLIAILGAIVAASFNIDNKSKKRDDDGE